MNDATTNSAHSIEWTRGPWTYRLLLWGHLWQFSGEFHWTEDGEPKSRTENFGTIPGGAFVAIQALEAESRQLAAEVDRLAGLLDWHAEDRGASHTATARGLLSRLDLGLRP